MNRKAFQIRRTPATRPVESGQKPVETQTRLYRQHSPDNVAITTDTKTTNLSRKPEPNAVNEVKQASDNEKLPRSAPLNQSKRLFRPKTELKEIKEIQKPNLQSSGNTNTTENKNTPQSNASRHSRIKGPTSEENKKGVVKPKREKGSLGKPPVISKRVSEEVYTDPFDLNEVNAISVQYGDKHLTEEVLEIQTPLVQREQSQTESNTSKQMEFTLAGFTPPKNQVDDQEIERIEKENNNGLRLQDDSLTEQVQLKNPNSVRGLFAKEHIPTSELLKISEQKRLMKEYLDFQTNEKKRKKEEERKREEELNLKEEQRIKKEMKNMEYKPEKETVMENEKKAKFQVNEIKRGGSPQLLSSSRDSRRTVNKDYLEQLSPGLLKNNEREQRDSQELKRSQEKKEIKERIIETLPDYIPEEKVDEQFKVEKLVEENMQLRNENTKKMEIIDILLNALKQKEQSGISSIVFPEGTTQTNPTSMVDLKNTGTRFRIPEVEMVSENKNNIKVFDQLEPKYITSPKNFKFNTIDPFNEDRQFQPFRDRQSENLYLSNTRVPLPGDSNYMADINKLAKVNTPARGIAYKMFTPNKKDQEYSSNIKNESSPRLPHGVRSHLHNSGLSVPGSATEASRSAFKNKNTLLPGLGAPSSSQLPYRSNLMTNGEQIVNGIRNYDQFRLPEGPFKKEEFVPKGRLQNISMKQSQSETIMKRADNVLKVMGDGTGTRNFNETFYPNPIGETYNHATFNGSSNIYPGGLSMKAEVGVLVLDDGNKVNYQPKDRDMMKSVKGQGNIIGMGAISVVDMASNNGLGHTAIREKDYMNINEDGGRLYVRENAGGISERKVATQGNDNKMKFPKEVFSINVKKKFYG